MRDFSIVNSLVGHPDDKKSEKVFVEQPLLVTKFDTRQLSGRVTQQVKSG